MLTKFGNKHIDVSEIAGIGELVLCDGKTCSVMLYLRGGAEIKVLFEGVGDERNNYDGPVKKIFSDRCRNEIDALIASVH